jgi:hypothetical protein
MLPLCSIVCCTTIVMRADVDVVDVLSLLPSVWKGAPSVRMLYGINDVGRIW